MNTDQGSQFASFAWTDLLRPSGVRISMNGKGRFLDNIFVVRLWRSLNCECVYLYAWETGSEAKPLLESGSSSTTANAPIPPLAEDPRPWSNS